MQEINIGRARVMTLAIVAMVALPICVGVYSSRSNAYRRPAMAASSTTKTVDFTNAPVLQNWLPSAVYSQTVNTINNYLASSSANFTSMSIVDNQIVTSNGAFDFSLAVQPGGATHTISVRVRNFDGTISTLIVIDGQAQGVQASSAPTTNPVNNNLDSFGAYGLSPVQINELQQAFIKFSPYASNIQVATPKYTYDNGTSSLNFLVSIDTTSYVAQAVTNDISSITLTLQDPQTHKQVFNSGVVGAPN